jgi:hypothetical protein
MADLSGFLTGFSNSLNQYLQVNNQNKAAQQNELYKNQLAEQSKMNEMDAQSQLDTTKGKDLEQNKIDVAGKVTPDMAESLIPGSSKWVSDFQTTNKRLPTVEEAKKGMEDALLKLSRGDDQEQKRQDMLEKQYHDRLVSVRGDQSLARTEKQRDAAAMAYDTIAKVKSENRDLTELEQTDVLAQLFQARTGKTPTDQDMQHISEQTAKRGFNHAITWASGNPTLVGASTQKTLDNILQFVDATGTKADQQNDAYMSPRLAPPTGLEKSRADHIAALHRGISYSEQKKVSDTTYTKQESAASDASNIHTYPSGRKAIFNSKTKQWEPYNG